MSRGKKEDVVTNLNGFKIGERFGSLEAKVEYLGSELNEAKESLKEIETDLKSGLTRVHERLDSIKQVMVKNGNCKQPQNGLLKLKRWQIWIGIILGLVALFGGVGGVIQLAKAIFQSLGG